MQVISDKLEGIELKLRQLALKMERLQSQNADLLDENKTLRLKLSKQDNAVGLLEDNLHKSQQSLEKMRETEPPGSKKIRKDIERYIKEIDKCIEWLNHA